MKTNHVYDDYEISGCYLLNDDDGRQFVETGVDDAEAQFWTLYGHITGQGVQAIGNFKSRKAAERVYCRITGRRFTGSYKANARLRLMHAATALLAACRMVVARWEHGDLAEAARACDDAIALATSTCPPWEADESYSVLLLYPDYANDSGWETYYAFVKASDAIEAVSVAQREAVAVNAEEGVEIDDPTDFYPLLVIQGHQPSEPRFNK
jgi:hypothetical protein